MTAPAIADYALLGDCRTAALVSRDGSIDWLCLPDFSSSSVFARLLDPHGGHFSLRPARPFVASRKYVAGTAVLETIFTTEAGVARVTDCLPLLDGARQIRPMREILRIVEGFSGSVAFVLSLDPRPDYAQRQPRPRHRGRLGWLYSWHNEVLHLRTDLELTKSGTALAGGFQIAQGERRAFSLCYSQSEPAILPPLGEEADRRLKDTLAWWRNWSALIAYDGPYREAVVRSGVTLKLLSFSPSGAIVAAPTTSLPEELGGTRNWDYRYCWLRDAGLTMQALLGIGVDEDAKGFLEWMLHATRLTWPRLKIMYDVYGRTRLAERELSHLAGYGDSRPVRVGNGASDQEQTDIYGEVIFAASSYVEKGGRIDRAAANMLAGLGRVVLDKWREPDSGIWEVRGDPRQFTFSKLMCWTAFDRLLKLHAMKAVDLGGKVAKYEAARAEIATLIDDRGFNPDIKAFTGELDGHHVDASLLLISTVGFREANDPRVVSTLALISERLSRDGLLQRYESGTDGLAGKEGSFTICSFWAVEQLAQSGKVATAERQFDHLLSFGNDLGLFAEEIDPDTGVALGNFPQAFTHVGLINAAVAIENARRAGNQEGLRP
jgi:GH15 family glucan-1,4-alpha-glucosidase